MSVADINVKLLLDDKSFDAKLKKNKKEVKDFGGVGQQAFKEVAGVVGKFAGAVGLAMGGVEAFNKVVNSSQTLADAWGSTMKAATTVVDNFFYALGSGDFSVFNAGLDGVIERAKEAHAALDDLGNVTISRNFAFAQDKAGFQKQLNIMRDTSASKADREKAAEEAKRLLSQMTEGNKTFYDSSINSIIAEVNARGGLGKGIEIGKELVEKALRVDLGADRAKARAQISAKYDEYQKAYNEATATHVYSFVPATHGATQISSLKSEYAGMSEENIASVVQAKVDALQEQYKDIIVLQTLLEMFTDEQLSNIAMRLSSAYGAEEQTTALAEQLRSVTASLYAKPSATSKKKKIISRERTIADAFAYDALSQMQHREKLRALGVPDMLDEIPINDLKKATPTLEEQLGKVQELAGAWGALGNAIGGTTGNVMAWIGASAQQIASIFEQVAALQAETAARKANTNAAVTEATSKLFSAHAGIPFAGIALGMSAVAAMIAMISSLPKFATGGVVTGPTVGLIGEAGPEAVIPLSKLDSMMSQGSRRVEVFGTLRARGKDLRATISNYDKVQNVR